MANATNIAAKEYINGNLYYNWISLSSSWTPLYAGKLSDGNNYVLEFRFTLASATTAINLSWFTAGDTFKGRPMYYKLLTAENSAYNNATNANHGDGTLNTPGYAFTNATNTISGTFPAGTYFLYLWQGATYGGDSFIHTSIYFSSAAYPFAITYTAVNSYSLTASVGSNVTLTVTITSSPYGRSGTLTPPATIYHGEVLQLNWTVATGYQIGTHTINGGTFSQGASTGAVSFNCAIVLTANAAVAEYTTVPSTYTTGTAATIKVQRYSSSYSHSIEVIQGGTTRQTLSFTWSGNTGTASWTPSAATYAPLNTSGNSVAVTLRLYTRSGGTVIGYKDASATITLSGINPTPSMTISDANGHLSTYGAYVQGRSAFYIVVSDGVQYGASTVSRTISANGATYSSSPATTAPISSSGYLTVSATVRDSRGNTGTYTQPGINVLPYSSPYCPTFNVHRTDGGGTPDETGSYFVVDWAVEISALNNQNSRGLELAYKETTAGTWTNAPAITLTSYTDSGSTAPISISTEKTYDIRLTVTDDFGSVVQTTRLSTIPATFDLLDGGNGAAFGKVAETGDLLDVAWNLHVAKALNVDGAGSVGDLNVSGTPTFSGAAYPKIVVAEGDSGIWHYVKYSDKTAELWGTSTGTTSTWTAWGSMQYSNTIPASAPAYPFSFISTPQVTVGFWSTLQTVGGFCNLGGTTTNAPTFVAMRPTAGNTSGVVSVCYYVRGRYA